MDRTEARRLATELVAQMTVEEKASQLRYDAPAIERLGIPAEIILSDNGTPARMDGSFDVFAGNPPYYSDYRIAEVFLETAVRALKPGGTCYTVVKNDAGLKPVQERYFPSVEVVRRRGYCVLKSVKTA